jgi:hypothetical protein
MDNDAAGYAMQEMASRFATIKGRHENGTAPRAVVVRQLFQTPSDLADRLAGLLDPKPGSRILEPSAGLGRLLDGLKFYEPAEVVAVEMAADCARELFTQDRSGVVIKQRDFLTVTPEEIGQFEAVIMNPPFTMRSDIRHILHAIQFVKPGGKLAGICMAGRHREEQIRPLCDRWLPLGPGTFKESGTDTPTVMFRITKQ